MPIGSLNELRVETKWHYHEDTWGRGAVTMRDVARLHWLSSSLQLTRKAETQLILYRALIAAPLLVALPLMHYQAKARSSRLALAQSRAPQNHRSTRPASDSHGGSNWTSSTPSSLGDDDMHAIVSAMPTLSARTLTPHILSLPGERNPTTASAKSRSRSSRERGKGTPGESNSAAAVPSSRA